MPTGLIKVEVHPTYRCNLRCTYCIGKQTKRKEASSLPKEFLLSLAAQIVQLPISHTVISALRGEPLLNHHTETFLRKLKEGPDLKQFTGLHTNGTQITDDIIETLTSDNRGGDYVSFHLSAPDSQAELYQRIHGGKVGTHKKVIAAIEKLAGRKAQKNAQVFLRINFLLTPVNYQAISDLERYVLEFGALGIDDIRFSMPIMPIGQKRGENLFLSQQQAAEILAASQFLNGLTAVTVSIETERFSIVHQGNSLSKCFVKDSALVISPDGMAAPCCYTAHAGFPYRIEVLDRSLDALLELMRNLAFNPAEVCPACSRTDFMANIVARTSKP
ncbi:hypothetical protein A3H38_03530 [candidate division WOR-1 bacterium RIFCSPLOWO2_02_FULL_46_20]|uniref:Radical SAM core domain-containing protein n=1 Tax=candidate division WOR-1 bacterium RIFCSPLOWO2_02_FULL_46_20 TaxID=1802567 RepID=A0A1F4RCP2_UNCSA|nr:MAG: hypothetical protein A3J44_04945 [candidate division WOR-1 bacterium RIFCSPHIGHO2_02_FULL_45_12]OGC05940.1 MAG: hypothetical protein A3H38_03530 [candidate division WOR-1 bacterium RIFCSPLOWO2_02_FULL_46_20]